MVDASDTFSADEVEGSQAPQSQSAPQQQLEATAPSNDVFSADEVEGAQQQEKQDNSQYSTPVEQLKTAAEGAAEGLAGFVAPAIETSLGISTPEAIRGRKEANPTIHGAAEVAGFGAGMFLGTGEAAVLSKAGNAAVKLAGLAEGANEASKAFKIGSAAVKSAAEMTVMQGSDEVSKMILKDPNTSAESAIANIGLSAALGGVGGAVITGAVSPLWKATIGPKVQEGLEMFTNRVSGSAVKAKSTVIDSLKTLGIDIAPELGGAMSDNARAQQFGHDLVNGGNEKFTSLVEDTKQKVNQAVQSTLPLTVDEIANHSESDAGKTLLDTFQKEDKAKFEPVKEALDLRNEQAAPIKIADVDRESQRNSLMELGLSGDGPGANSPYYKLYEDAGQRMLDTESIGELDKWKTEMNGEVREAFRKGEENKGKALQQIINHTNEFQESQITYAMTSPANAKLAHTDASLNALIQQRMGANTGYREYAKMQNDLTNHLNIGDFKGRGALQKKLTEKLSPEQALKKFTTRGNADFGPFMQQHYPETFTKMQQNETRQFLKPAVTMDAITGGATLNFKKLSKLMDTARKGSPELLNSVLSPEAQQKIQAANNILNQLPDGKKAAQMGSLAKMFNAIPSSALAAVGWMTGHGPIASGLLKYTAEHLGTVVPQASKLSYLRMLTSEAAPSADGFKATYSYFNHVFKGQQLLAKGASSVFSGAAIASYNPPDSADREKLSKQVDKFSQDPSKFVQGQQDGNLGVYAADHHLAASATMTRALQYCAQLKPRSIQSGVLDNAIEPSKIDTFRYNRCLDIAHTPNVLFDHIKDGTLQTTDVQDIKMMYPGVYKQMQNNLMAEVTKLKDAGNPVPMRIQQSVSLFMGQALNSSMTPASILAAQPQSKMPPPMMQQGGKISAKAGTELKKGANSYKTTTQAAEGDRSSRD